MMRLIETRFGANKSRKSRESSVERVSRLMAEAAASMTSEDAARRGEERR
jgi:hypothetical protein